MAQPILSISILISGKYDNVKNCLDSIQPILREVPSELILTDTGCSADVRHLIEGYTDHIIDFTWIDDFSAARNAGLQEAKGKWFMYLDDDEWFEGTSDIIDFLLSEQRGDYDVALYYQRNYESLDQRQYFDYAVDRILRRLPELHFENRVHEAYVGLDAKKRKQLQSYVHHVGYVYQTEEDKIRKFERNHSLLQLECREKPGNMRLWRQYATSCWMVEKWEESKNICQEAIKRESNSTYWDLLHADYLYCLSMQEKWQEIIETGKGFLEKTLYPYPQFGVRQYMLQAYFKTGQFGEICKMAPKMINNYRYYKKSPEEFADGALDGNIFFGRDQISRMLTYIMIAAICQKEREALKLLENQEISGEVGSAIADDLLRDMIVGYLLQFSSQESIIELMGQSPVIQRLVEVSGYLSYLEQSVCETVVEKKVKPIVLDSLDFSPEFFQPEIRDGFAIEPLIKNAWAAQLEMLERIRQICQEHEITYFVDWGTMLGAVRHHGFIPWDDDVDIGMLREDYRKFCQVIEAYEDIQICNEYNMNKWGTHASRITSQIQTSVQRENVKAHRGFPFPAGVDVFVVDYVPDDKALRDEQKYALNQVAAAYTAKLWLEDHEPCEEQTADHYMQYRYLVRWIRKECGVDFSREHPSSRELLILIDEVAGMYGADAGHMMTQADCFVNCENYFISEDAYKEMIMMPFENIMVPVPVGYDEILRAKYGDDYMTPRNIGAGHGYPFYDLYIRDFFDLSEDDDLTKEKKYIEKLSSNYYCSFIHKTKESQAVLTKESHAEDDREKIRAAKLEVLVEIQRLCKEHDLRYYAYGDTLRGAIADHGFAPGSEDIDIAMPREDYQKFLEIVPVELGAWFDYRNLYANGDHTDMRCYIMSDSFLVDEDAYRERFHDCPYMVAVCVAAIDQVPAEGRQYEMQTKYIKTLLDTAAYMPTEPPYDEEIQGVVAEWRNMSDIVVDMKANLKREFVRCADVVARACREQSGKVRISAELQKGIDRLYDQTCFEEVEEVPFESIMIAVPKKYDTML